MHFISTIHKNVLIFVKIYKITSFFLINDNDFLIVFAGLIHIKAFCIPHDILSMFIPIIRHMRNIVKKIAKAIQIGYNKLYEYWGITGTCFVLLDPAQRAFLLCYKTLSDCQLLNGSFTPCICYSLMFSAHLRF